MAITFRDRPRPRPRRVRGPTRVGARLVDELWTIADSDHFRGPCGGRPGVWSLYVRTGVMQLHYWLRTVNEWCTLGLSGLRSAIFRGSGQLTTGEAGSTVQRAQRTPNTVLRGIRESERHESRNEFAEAMARAAWEMGVEVYPDGNYVQRLESGHVTWPHRTYRTILERLCDRPARELGFAPSVRSSGDSTGAYGEVSTRVNVRLREAIWESGMEITEFARKIGVDPKTAERWITRGMIPQPARRWKASLILGIDESELWPNASPHQEIPLRKPRIASSRESAGKEQPPERNISDSAAIAQKTVILADEGGVERRQLLRIFGGIATVPVIAGIDRTRRELENSLNSSTTGADAEEFERVALQYANEVGRVPLMQVIPDLLTDLDEAQLRLAGSQDACRLRMMRVCGQLSALMAISFLNIGEFRIANRYWRTATRAVDETNDRNLQSLIRGRRAVFALYDDKTPPSSILALAKDAIDIADGTPCAGVASGYAASAQVLALLGQHEESNRTVQELADIFELLPELTAIDRRSQWGWSEQRLRHVESHVYSYAGRFNDATAAQEAALALYPKDGYQGRTQVELYKSICIIRGGDPAEGARHAIRTVQSLPSSRQNDAVVRRTATLMLNVIPESAANLSSVLEARDLLALPGGSS